MLVSVSIFKLVIDDSDLSMPVDMFLVMDDLDMGDGCLPSLDSEEGRGRGDIGPEATELRSVEVARRVFWMFSTSAALMSV